jgi:hypothetical protein
VAFNQLGQGDHCCFSSKKWNKTDFSRPNDWIVSHFYRLKGEKLCTATYLPSSLSDLEAGVPS